VPEWPALLAEVIGVQQRLDRATLARAKPAGA